MYGTGVDSIWFICTNVLKTFSHNLNTRYWFIPKFTPSIPISQLTYCIELTLHMGMMIISNWEDMVYSTADCGRYFRNYVTSYARVGQQICIWASSESDGFLKKERWFEEGGFKLICELLTSKCVFHTLDIFWLWWHILPSTSRHHMVNIATNPKCHFMFYEWNLIVKD